MSPYTPTPNSMSIGFDWKNSGVETFIDWTTVEKLSYRANNINSKPPADICAEEFIDHFLKGHYKT